MFNINFTASVKKSIILTIFSLFLLSCIALLMIGSSFHVAQPPEKYLGIDSLAQTKEHRISFLEKLGYSPAYDHEESEQVRIPIEFGDVYNKYNELQKQSGGDLLNYRGADCIRYTYINKDERRLNLLVYENRVIGGDVCTVSLDGEMKPLSKLKLES